MLTPPKTFGQLVREKRRALDITQGELANRAGVSLQLIGAIERGERENNTRDTICKLAVALSFTLDEAGMILCPQLARAA